MAVVAAPGTLLLSQLAALNQSVLSLPSQVWAWQKAATNKRTVDM
jgi:hypothetical protein